MVLSVKLHAAKNRRTRHVGSCGNVSGGGNHVCSHSVSDSDLLCRNSLIFGSAEDFALSTGVNRTSVVLDAPNSNCADRRADLRVFRLSPWEVASIEGGHARMIQWLYSHKHVAACSLQSRGDFGTNTFGHDTFPQYPPRKQW